MSLWGARRQFSFLVILLLILVIMAAGGLWWFWPKASCSDGKRNQDELGIDCGGSCLLVCQVEALPVRVLWSRVLPLGGQTYDLAALVHNPNSKLALEEVTYSARILDEKNLFVTRVTGTINLAPLEQTLIFKTNIDVGKRLPARVVIDFTTTPRWRYSSEHFDFETSDKQFTNLPVPLLKAKVMNRSTVPYREVEVGAVLADGEHNAIASSLTLIPELGSGETKEISFSWPRPLPVEPVFIDLYPHVAIKQPILETN